MNKEMGEKYYFCSPITEVHFANWTTKKASALQPLHVVAGV